jgi:SH3-like domain-containing protein
MTKYIAIGILFFLTCGTSSSALAEPRDEPVCVVAPKAKLRSGPSTSSKITWIVGKHMPLQRIAVENGWSQVRDLRGQTHWVYSKSVSVNESCAVVRVRTAALHTGPGTNQPRAEFKVADRYTPFKKVDREGSWVRLEDDYRGSYWTRDSNVWIPVKRSRMSF